MGRDMQPRFNVWFEIEGEVATSIWRAELLDAVGRAGSITQGAELMDVPYRVAWQKIHEMEERLDVKLLETATGGPEGGGASLTEAGRNHVARMAELSRRVEQAVAEIASEVVE